MRILNRILPLVSVIALLTACTGTQYTSAYDDIHYSPKDDVKASVEEVAPYVDIDDRAAQAEAEQSEYARGRKVDEYYDPEYKKPATDYQEGYRDGYSDRYQDDSYYYSSRFRRFNNPSYGFNYYDPFYSNSNYYSYDPYFWSPRVVRPGYYSPGWGFGWNSQFGWTASYNSGWFNYYGGYGYGYNPYSYYGNVYCPPYGAGGYAYNDFYNNASPVFRGQYNSLGSRSSSSSTTLGKLGKEASLSPGAMSVRPQSVTSSAPQTRPLDGRPSHTSNPIYERPVTTRPQTGQPQDQNTRPVEYARPTDTERPIDYARPTDSSRPTETRPNEGRPVVIPNPSRENPTPSERPHKNYRETPPKNNNRGNNSASPSRSNNSGSSTRSSSSPSRSNSNNKGSKRD